VGCHDTPMVKGLGPGEWWRSPSDWHYDACAGARARAASALDVPAVAAPRPLITERVVDRTVVLH
jgi:hypothetical protein